MRCARILGGMGMVHLDLYNESRIGGEQRVCAHGRARELLARRRIGAQRAVLTAAAIDLSEAGIDETLVRPLWERVLGRTLCSKARNTASYLSTLERAHRRRRHRRATAAAADSRRHRRHRRSPTAHRRRRQFPATAPPPPPLRGGQPPPLPTEPSLLAVPKRTAWCQKVAWSIKRSGTCTGLVQVGVEC